jgi:choline monooxygenase
MLVETLPAHWYVDAGILARERETIFARNWALFGPEEQVAEPGTWRADTVNGWPLLVARGEDGRLRAFHNVCRHRGAALLGGDSARGRLAVCPYHAWSYDLTGRLVATPNFGEVRLDKPAYGLLPVAVDTWGGLVFVRVSPEGESLRTWLGSIPSLAEPFAKTADLALHADRITIEGSCNWKAYCDNTVEGYHLPTVHKRLNAAIDRDNTSIVSKDGGRLVVFDVTYASDGSGLRGAKGIWFYRFPGFQGVLGGRIFKADRIEPVTAGRMRYSNWSWYRDLSGTEIDDSQAWSKQIAEEDIGVCESVQRNMEAGVYTTGVLSPLQEGHIAAIQRLVRDAVGA